MSENSIFYSTSLVRLMKTKFESILSYRPGRRGRTLGFATEGIEEAQETKKKEREYVLLVNIMIIQNKLLLLIMVSDKC